MSEEDVEFVLRDVLRLADVHSVQVGPSSHHTMVQRLQPLSDEEKTMADASTQGDTARRLAAVLVKRDLSSRDARELCRSLPSLNGLYARVDRELM